MNSLRNRIHPGLRGAFFYGAYWGATGMYDPFLAVFYLQNGLDGTQIGWLAAIMPLCTLAIAPLVTRLADRFHQRVVFLALACLGLGLALTAPVLPGFRATFAGLIVFLSLFSVFRSPVVALADSLIGMMAMRRALDFGSMRLWGSLLYTFSAAALGVVWQRTGFNTMFIAAAVGFLPVITAALLLEDAPRVTSQAAASPALPQPAIPAPRFVIDFGLLCLLGATFLVIAALFMAGTFGSIFMTQLGGSAGMVGLMGGLSALGEVPGMLFGSRIARRLGDTNTLMVGYVVCALGHAGFALTVVPWGLLVFSALRGLGFGLLLVSTVMIINHRAPRELTATYQGIMNSACWGLAPLLGGPISGAIFQNYGPAALFFTAAGLTATSAVLILPTYRLWRAAVKPEIESSPAAE